MPAFLHISPASTGQSTDCISHVLRQPLKLKPGQQVIRGEEPYTWKLVSEEEAAQPAVIDSQATLQGVIDAKEAELVK